MSVTSPPSPPPPGEPAPSTPASSTPSPSQSASASASSEAGPTQRVLREGFPWVTAAIGALCVLLFVLSKHWTAGNYNLVLYLMGANSGTEIRDGEVWRLFAAAFLHGDIAHLAVNMVALASFGPMFEKLLGAPRYVLLYGLSALGGGLASALLRDAGIAVGASGAIWGLMTAGVGLALRPRDLLPPAVIQQMRSRAALPLIINIFYSFKAGIDLWAHFGGGIVGLVLMLSGIITRGVVPVWRRDANAPEKPSLGITVAAAVMSLAMLGSVAAALVQGRPWEIGEPPQLTQVQVADTGIAVDLPRGIATSPTREDASGYTLHRYGDLRTWPVIAEVIVVALPKELSPEEAEQQLQSELQQLEGKSPPGLELKSGPKIETLGGRRFVTVQHHTTNVSVHYWLTVVGDREVIVRIYARDDRPASWNDVEQGIVTSVKRQ
jgi:rhomboid protease GluP